MALLAGPPWRIVNGLAVLIVLEVALGLTASATLRLGLTRRVPAMRRRRLPSAYSRSAPRGDRQLLRHSEVHVRIGDHGSLGMSPWRTAERSS